MTLHLALIATEGLFGRALVRLEAQYELDEEHHVIAVDTGTEVGAVVVRVFTALLIREFGEEAFSIQHTNRPTQPQKERNVNVTDQPDSERSSAHAATTGGVRDRGHREEHVCSTYFYRCLPDSWKRLCDWSCEAQHLGPRGRAAISYWEGRKDLRYYRQAVEFTRKHAPDAKSLLDVGGGVSLGCRYLEWFDWIPDRRSIERRDDEHTLDGVQVEFADFAEWQAPQSFDVVLCLQVLEHQENAREFAQKLLQTGSVVIASVPYRWLAGTCSDHRHDPVDEAKLHEWFGCDPIESKIEDTRLVAVYQGAAA